MRSPRGQSLIEIVISISLFAVVATAFISLAGGHLTSAEERGRSLGALTLAEEGLEVSRAVRDQNWSSLTAGTHGVTVSASAVGFQGTSDSANGFTRTVTVTDQSANEKQVTAAVSWSTGGGLRTSNTSLGTLITNWRAIGAALLHGNWQNPQTLGTIDIGAGNSATSLTVAAGIVSLTATAADDKKHDFYIVDATNPQTPVILGSVNTGPGLVGVTVQGNYAFLANDDDDAQFQVIDTTNRASPTLAATLALSNNDGEARSVASSGTIAYLGTERDSGPEFFTIDVANPLSPVVRGSLEIDADVNDITVFQNRIFLATSHDTREFMVVNATNPASPSFVTAVDIPGGTEEGRGVYMNSQDNRGYLARTAGGNHATHHELAILDLTSPDSPTLLGSLNFTNDVNSVFAADTLAFLATATSNEEFKIFDVSNPQSITYYSGLNFPQVATDLAFENNIIYVSVRSNDALRIITSQ